MWLFGASAGIEGGSLLGVRGGRIGGAIVGGGSIDSSYSKLADNSMRLIDDWSPKSLADSLAREPVGNPKGSSLLFASRALKLFE